jgi:hypothetical protein
VIFTVALASHVAAHGVILDASALVRLFMLTVLALAPLAGVSMSPTQVAALLLGGQGLLHMAFQLLGGRSVGVMPTNCAAAMGAAALHSPTGVHAMGSHLMTPLGMASQGFAMSAVGGGHAVMLLAHLAAAIVADNLFNPSVELAGRWPRHFVVSALGCARSVRSCLRSYDRRRVISTTNARCRSGARIHLVSAADPTSKS